MKICMLPNQLDLDQIDLNCEVKFIHLKMQLHLNELCILGNHTLEIGELIALKISTNWNQHQLNFRRQCID